MRDWNAKVGVDSTWQGTTSKFGFIAKEQAGI